MPCWRVPVLRVCSESISAHVRRWLASWCNCVAVLSSKLCAFASPFADLKSTLGCGSFGKVFKGGRSAQLVLATHLACAARHAPARSAAGAPCTSITRVLLFAGSWGGRPVAVKVLQYGAELTRAVHNEVVLSQSLRWEPWVGTACAAAIERCQFHALC